MGEFSSSFETNGFLLQYKNETSGLSVTRVEEEDKWKSPAIVLLVQIGTSLIASLSAKFACKSSLQRLGFALPVSLVTPVCLSSLLPLCYYRLADSCAFSSAFPTHLFFQCPTEISG